MGLTRKQWIMLSILGFGSFVTVLNQTVVTPALPSMMDQLHVDAATIGWLTTGFTLVNAIMVPVTAYLQDRFSVKALFQVSMALFTAGTVLCGWGLDFNILLIGRLVQAAGAGVLMPMTMTVLMVTFPIEKRGTALGLFGLVTAFAPAIGPTVSGIVIDVYDWHILFYAVAVLALLLIVASIFGMGKRKPVDSKNVVLDKLSLVLSTIGFGSLLYGFSVIGSSGIDVVSGVSAVIGIVTLIWFFRRQLRIEHPMLKVQVLANPKFLIGTIIGMLIQAALLAAGILMPIYIQTLCGYPATVSGLVLMPGAIIMGIMGPVAGKLFDKHGPRVLGIVGMALLTITTFGFAILNLNSPIVYITILYAVRMFAMSIVNMPITTWGMNALSNDLLNHGTSVNNTLRQVAGSLGTALVLSVSTATTNATTASLGDVQATMLGINAAFGVCTLLSLIGMILTIAKVKDRPGKISVPRTVKTEGASSILRTIMNREVFALSEDDTIEQAIRLFLDKNISAAPIVNDEGEAIGFISDGDILRRLSRQSSTFIDPIIMIMRTVNDEQDYHEKLEDLMQKRVKDIGVNHAIGVDIDADLSEVCRVLSENHLKKMPVLEHGRIVGVINRSDITQHTMSEYLKKREAEGFSANQILNDSDELEELAGATGADVATGVAEMAAATEAARAGEPVAASGTTETDKVAVASEETGKSNE